MDALYDAAGAARTIPQVIHYALGPCSLGTVLAASSGRGICALLLGDAPDALLRDLQERFPRAELRAASADADPALAAALAALAEAPHAGLQLPRDLRGTAFQQRVWQALREVPAGHTITYAALAARLGMPNGARAVAGACAANPVAIAVPCHRVVRGDGTLSGYRWGVERKRALLERERAGAI